MDMPTKLVVPDVLVPGDEKIAWQSISAPLPQATVERIGRGSPYDTLKRMFGMESHVSLRTPNAPKYFADLAHQARMEVVETLAGAKDPEMIERVYHAVMKRHLILVNRYQNATYELLITATALTEVAAQAGKWAEILEERRKRQAKLLASRQYRELMRTFLRPSEGSYLFAMLEEPNIKLLPFITDQDYRMGVRSISKGYSIITECYEPAALAERGKGRYAVITVVLPFHSGDNSDALVTVSNFNNVISHMVNQNIVHVTPDWCPLKVVKIVDEATPDLLADINKQIRDIIKTNVNATFRETPANQDGAN